MVVDNLWITRGEGPEERERKISTRFPTSEEKRMAPTGPLEKRGFAGVYPTRIIGFFPFWINKLGYKFA